MELETLICGRRQLDVELLKSIAIYEAGVVSTDQHILWFWEVMENEMSDENKTDFLKFVWARSRLPPRNYLFTSFKIQLPSNDQAKMHPDKYLPSAQTCFFSLTLPKYSTKEILKSKLLSAISTMEMDADVRLRSGEGWGDV